MQKEPHGTITAADLRFALEADAFELHWQPIMDMATGVFTSFEALLRWNRGGKQVPPLTVIAAAEESGQVDALDSYVALKAATAAAGWNPAISAGFNVSATEFTTGRVVGLVGRALEASGMDPRRLHVELTEGVLIDSPFRSIAVLKDLKSMGVVVTLDDFGTVYSSLSYLDRMEFDCIKLDRQFLRGCPDRARSCAIVRAVMNLGRDLGHEVIVEGVERQDQLDFLRSEGCRSVQGRFIGWPEPASRYAGILGIPA